MSNVGWVERSEAHRRRHQEIEDRWASLRSTHPTKGAMTQFNSKLAEVVRRDARYQYEAYEFIFQGLYYTQKMLGRAPQTPGEIDPQDEAKHHVSGPELAEGIRQLALREFGLMARTVFHMWGLRRTDDFGEIVFNLIEGGLMSRTDEDTRQDFRGIYDFDEALVQGYRIQLDEAREA